jgi:hypothetical protein
MWNVSFEFGARRSMVVLKATHQPDRLDDGRGCRECPPFGGGGLRRLELEDRTLSLVPRGAASHPRRRDEPVEKEK